MTIDSREFRDALGCFATGVTVITANPEAQQPFGMTVNSFASVSLDPPLVLWSLQNNSEMFDVWERASTFGVNILRADQQDLSNLYARKGDHLLEADHFVAGITGVPVLPDSLVSMECEVEARYPGGDHGEPLLFCAGGYRELGRT